MKQLKCENCGGTIEVDDKEKDFATCPFCKAKYQLNERKDINISIDDNVKELFNNTLNFPRKSAKFVVIPIFIFAIIIMIAIIFSFKGQKSFDITDFNSSYEHYSGTNSKFLIESLLDKVVTNNKTNKKKLITVVYKDKETTDPDTIIEIKHSLEDRKKYEIKFDYNDDGYINKVTIEDI